MALHFISFLFSVASMVLLIMTNIGTTFTSSSLNKVYLVELKDSATSRSIRYGVYNSCIYYNSSSTPQSCISSAPAYSFDATQFATLCGASSSKSSTYTELVSSSNVNSLFKSIAIILPTTLLAFVAFSCTLLLRKNRENNRIPLIGSFASLLSFLVGAAGLALVLVVFLKGLPALEKQVDGLSHSWGAAIYFFGFGVLCTLGTFICFIVSFFVQDTKKTNDDFTLNDYGSTTKANEAYQPEFSPEVITTKTGEAYEPEFSPEVITTKAIEPEFSPEVITTPPGYYPPQQHTEPTPYQSGYYPAEHPESYQPGYPQEQPQSPIYNQSQAPHTFETYPQPTQPYHQGQPYDQKPSY